LVCGYYTKYLRFYAQKGAKTALQGEKAKPKTLRLFAEIKLCPAAFARSKNAPKGLPAYYPKNFKNARATLFRLFDPNEFSGIISAAFSLGKNDISDIPVDHRRPREYP
jgi:hypothetical protein